MLESEVPAFSNSISTSYPLKTAKVLMTQILIKKERNKVIIVSR
jgi:hypothetical protein